MLSSKEVRRFAGIFFTIAAFFTAAGFAVHPASGLLAVLSAAAYGAAFFAFTAMRYRRIAHMSEQIDLVLHDADRIYLQEYEEGELAILQNEIGKLTVRLREQNDTLKREKKYLADSLADIAHQLRTPLTSAGLTLPMLRSAQGKERETLLRQLRALFAQMDWLLSSLLALSRLDAGIIELRHDPLEVQALIEAALRPLQIPMELHETALQTDIPAGAVLSGDIHWLAEAIRNILKNCMESAGDGGSIKITVSDTPLCLQIHIRDSGPGFAEKDLPRLFDRFYRGKASGAAGYGIGLALCKTILTRQGASVCAQNHPQGGALFTLRFPK